MSVTEIRYQLQRTTRKYILVRSMEVAMISLAIGLGIACVVLVLPIPPVTAYLLGVAGGAAYAWIRVRQLRLFKLSFQDVLRYVNRTYPEMQDSGELLLLDDDQLNSLEKIQQSRSARTFESLYPTLKLPSALGKASMMFVASILLAGATFYLANWIKRDSTNNTTYQLIDPVKEVIPAEVKSVDVSVAPPAYTGLGKQSLSTFGLNVAEGSTVDWKLSFTQTATDARLILYGRDTLRMKEASDAFTAKTRIINSGFYQLSWKNEDKTIRHSDFFQITSVRDQPPVVKITNLEQFIQLSMTDNLKVNMKSTVADDYGLHDAYVIATVSKGSGESIKFREEKLKFDNPNNFQGKSLNARLQLDLKKLGLDPGDELYFYVEAHDNKQPQANKSRTETYFISLKDTTQMETSIDPGLGVDLLPEYFRSQRQIIIDTEKLLKDKSKITQQRFKSKSNELGYDEKVLRLRYGEFLGEEFTSSIGPQGGPPADDSHEEDVTKAYGHQHDTEKEHAAMEESKSSQQHNDHKDDKGDPSKEYMHAHDSEEEATFFTQSIRAKLKAAVSIMWDAELHLRMFDPKKSLPYQYKALKLLKEISQDSRIYVHRTGFDPPPLKEEKRLSGDFSEAKNSSDTKQKDVPENYKAIRKTLKYLELLDAGKQFNVTPEVKALLMKAGNELSTVALQQPGKYLKSLSLLKSLSESELNQDEIPIAIAAIKATFYQVLPVEPYTPQARKRSMHPLEDQFLENISSDINPNR